MLRLAVDGGGTENLENRHNNQWRTLRCHLDQVEEKNSLDNDSMLVSLNGHDDNQCLDTVSG
jgi:hypothetical protein